MNKKPEQGQAVEPRLEDVDVITEFTQDLVGKEYKSGTKIEDTSKMIKYTVDEYEDFFNVSEYPYFLVSKLFDYESCYYWGNCESYYEEPSDEESNDEQPRIQMKVLPPDDDGLYLGYYNCYEVDYEKNACVDMSKNQISIVNDGDIEYVSWVIVSMTDSIVVVKAVPTYGDTYESGTGHRGQVVTFAQFCNGVNLHFIDKNGVSLGSELYDSRELFLLGVDYDIEYWNIMCSYLYFTEEPCECFLTERNSQLNVTLINDNTRGTAFVIYTNGFDRTENPRVNGEGDSIYVSVKPNVGYKEVVVVTDSDGNVIENTICKDQKHYGNYTFIMPNKDVTITVTYELIKYSVEVITPDETKDWDINLNDLTNVAPGETVVYSAEPIQGYELVGVDIVNNTTNKKITPTVNNGEYSFTMPGANVTITPVFEKVKNAIIVEDNTSTEDYDINVDNMTAVEYDESIVISFTPEEGYELVGLTIVDEDNQAVAFQETGNPNEYEFVMPDKDVTITPTYQLIQSGSTPDDPTTEDPISEDSNNQSTEVGETPPNTDEVKTSVLGTIAFSLLLVFFVYTFIFFRKKYSRRKKYR